MILVHYRVLQASHDELKVNTDFTSRMSMSAERTGRRQSDGSGVGGTGNARSHSTPGRNHRNQGVGGYRYKD